MIPYLEWTHVQIGPLTLYVWGFFVALGILLGLQVSRWFGREKELRDELILDAAMWGVMGGVVGARFVYVFFYNPGDFLNNVSGVFAIWDGGMSMVGGLFGAFAAILFFLRKEKGSMLEYVDALTFGLPLGYGCGRIGCFLIHDHPGTATHFFLGVKYPDGVVRHDHGLYLSLFGFLMAAVFYGVYAWAKKNGRHVRAGTWTAAYLISYGCVRIALDFFRARDTIYAGLTPAQWASFAFIAAGVLLIWRMQKK